MKLLATFATAAVAASALFAVAPASAQVRHVVRERTVVRHTGPRHHARTVCTTHYEHHHRVRRCRTVR